MTAENPTPDQKFRKSLFNFYMDKQSRAMNFKTFNTLVGGTAFALSVAAGGPIGLGLAVVAGTAATVNEVRMRKKISKDAEEHQRVMLDVYDYKKAAPFKVNPRDSDGQL